jgi:precorrin-6Y C5,15-methyltransferase (decarboxylating)
MPSREGGAVDATVKWLTIVGIGEDGLAGLSANARAAIEEADTVFGGKRHLELAAPAINGEARAWPSPFDAAMGEVVARRGTRVCVLASGDPFCHGVGATLARRIPPAEFVVYPAPSAFSLAATRLGWALQDVEAISLHGRPLSLIRPLLHDGAHILALTSDGKAPSDIAALLTANGFGGSRFLVLEALGGVRENIHELRAADVSRRSFADLNVVAIEAVASAGAAVVPLAGMLDDELFENDGQITKREIRAITLSSLAPRRGELLWDIGGGSGSIAISWMLAHSSLRAIAIEKDADRAARIARNAANLGAPGLSVVEGAAPQALAGLPMPDAVFIGGGGSDAGVIDGAVEALWPGGRLVANAVTLQMEAVLLDCRARLGGALTRIAVSRAAPVGTMEGWRPALPVTQWVWSKP